MTGAFLNALGILLGALFGLAQTAPLSLRMQEILHRGIGAATAFLGLRLVWLGVNGTFWMCVKQIILAVLAMTIGHLIGRIFRLQKISNRLGRHAGNLIALAQAKSRSSRPVPDGIVAATILYCAAPLGLIGAVTDGLAGDFYLLAVKAAMDGIAMSGFVKMFRWPSVLSAFPVYAFLGAVTQACQFHAKPFLDAHGLTDSVTVAAGFVAGAVALVILEVRRVELANYLPALVVAPLLAWLLGR